MLFAKFSIFLTLFILFAVYQQPALALKKSYIVYLGGHSHGPDVTTADLQKVAYSHNQLLANFLGSEEKANDAIFYSYRRHINGFAALLEEEEAAEIAKHPDVVSVFLNQGKKLHTTRSWDFLMLEKNGVIHPSSLWEKARYGEDIIIGNLDTGVWPESKSFSGKGYGPIPSKWKGICQFNKTEKHLCNRKLIGARYYNKGYEAYVHKQLNSSYHTARDNFNGHGTHTLSTAGGNFVHGANYFGRANGTAKGGSPRARVAAYRVCYPPVNGFQCFDADIMKAFDKAIHDGVDVLSVSLGGDARDYFNDGIAIGSFHAVKNGAVVVASASNSGPTPGTVTNVAPWIITVGASTIDREFQANVKLKNGAFLKGTSSSKPLPHDGFYPLIISTHARAANVSEDEAELCEPETLDPKKVKGKIVVCLRGDNVRVEKGVEAARAGAAGMILYNDDLDGDDINHPDPHFLPATLISYSDGLTLISYIKTTKNPKGRITAPKDVLNVKPAPVMAAFSSRGPNMVNPEILKPDITAPGVQILAAFSEVVSSSGLPIDHRITPFVIDSGTSMSCPHVSGIVGLLKTLYPHWSSAAIKSAIMTTARIRDNRVDQMRDSNSTKATPFAYGSGHIRPNRAMDPGLVYDLSINDYLDFLCGIGYNQSLISRVSGSNHHYDCPKKYNLLNFNYPSISVPGLSDKAVTVKRTLKNVGKPGIYASRVRQPPGFSVTVEPTILHFKKVGQEKSFKLTIKVVKATQSSTDFRFGQLIWSDGSHYVRSPIAVSSADRAKSD